MSYPTRRTLDCEVFNPDDQLEHTIPTGRNETTQDGRIDAPFLSYSGYFQINIGNLAILSRQLRERQHESMCESQDELSEVGATLTLMIWCELIFQ